MRKPHNLITAYWDDMRHFQLEAEKVERVRELYDRCYIAAVVGLPDEDEVKKAMPNLPTFDKRGIRYAILSSCLFLEAFINQEYFDEMGFKNSPSELNSTQKKNLDEVFIIPHGERICAKGYKKRVSKVRFESTKNQTRCLPSTSAKPTLSVQNTKDFIIL